MSETNFKRRASAQQISAYLDLLGATANSFNKLKIDLDEKNNIIDATTKEVLFDFDILPLEKKLQIDPNYNEAKEQENKNEFEEVGEELEEENEFEAVGDKPIFVDCWKPSVNEVKVLVFLGAGRTLKSKRGDTKTWLFFEPSANNYLLVPQWTSAKYFETADAKESRKYRLTYSGKVEPKDGNSFHNLRIERGNILKLDIKHDFNRLLSDYENNS